MGLQLQEPGWLCRAYRFGKAGNRSLWSHPLESHDAVSSVTCGSVAHSETKRRWWCILFVSLHLMRHFSCLSYLWWHLETRTKPVMQLSLWTFEPVMFRLEKHMSLWHDHVYNISTTLWHWHNPMMSSSYTIPSIGTCC